MKKDLHPEFNTGCVVTCSCGATHTIGSTLTELKVEICSKCHPFFTGKSKLVDTEGRVDKFRKRQQIADESETTETPTEEKAEAKDEAKTEVKAESEAKTEEKETAKA